MDHREDRHARRQHRRPTRNDSSGSGKKSRPRHHQRLRSKRRQTTSPDGLTRTSSTRQKDDSSRHSPWSRPSSTRIPLQDHRWRHQSSRRSHNRHRGSWVRGSEDPGSTRWSKTRGHRRRDRTLRKNKRRPEDSHLKEGD